MMAGCWRSISCNHLLVVLQCITVLGCTSPPPLHQPLELIQRVPIQKILVSGHQVAYLDLGMGPPLVFIHGFGGSMWNWEHQYTQLSSRYRVIVPDLLGSGLSDKPNLAYTPQQLVRFFHEFLQVLDLPHVSLIGNSMGAGMAMALALDYPNQVNRLVLISGFPDRVSENIASKHYQRFLHHRPPLWLAKLGNWMANRGATEHLLKEIIYLPHLITPTVIERSYQNRKRGGFLPPLYSLLDNIDQWESQYGQRLSQISHPVLLIWGNHDRVFPLPVGEKVRQLLPQAQWHVIQDAGHMPQWEQPTVVNSLIESFILSSPH